MLGMQFIKAQPTTYLIEHRKGKRIREGAGLSFYYFAPFTTLVAIPIGSIDIPFIFQEVTADFQEVTVQGQTVYRVADPGKLAQMLNFTLNPKASGYVSEDPQKLPTRVINCIQVLMRNGLQNLPLREALRSADELVRQVRQGLINSDILAALGLEVLDLSVLAIKPTPETARAIEADMREQLLRAADEAIDARRNAAIERERAIKENELDTQVALENKKRQIREAQMDAEIAIQEKNRVMREEDMAARISLEEKNRGLVALVAENQRSEADTKAYALTALMKSFQGMEPRVVQFLAGMGMEPDRIVAAAFQQLAENAEKIGVLNISPDLLQTLMKKE